MDTDNDSSESLQDEFARLRRRVAELEQAREPLRESERLYRAAIEAAGAVPYYQEYIPGGGESVYTFMGEGHRRLTGFGPEEMTPGLMASITQEMVMVGEGAGLTVDETFQRARSGKLEVWQCDMRIRTRDGQTRWIADTAVVILDEQGVARVHWHPAGHYRAQAR